MMGGRYPAPMMANARRYDGTILMGAYQAVDEM